MLESTQPQSTQQLAAAASSGAQMASPHKTLGLHTPSGAQYCFAEQPQSATQLKQVSLELHSPSPQKELSKEKGLENGVGESAGLGEAGLALVAGGDSGTSSPGPTESSGLASVGEARPGWDSTLSILSEGKVV